MTRLLQRRESFFVQAANKRFTRRRWLDGLSIEFLPSLSIAGLGCFVFVRRVSEATHQGNRERKKRVFVFVLLSEN